MPRSNRKKRSHQLRYVLRNRTTKQVYLVVLFTLYLREDVNEDGTLKPEAARAYTTHAPAAMEEQAAIANEEDAKEPDFDGEAALEKARKHLSDVDLAKQDDGATNEPDDVD
jgi:spore germination cell wall hydrolase CwlJ-like protein